MRGRFLIALNCTEKLQERYTCRISENVVLFFSMEAVKDKDIRVRADAFQDAFSALGCEAGAIIELVNRLVEYAYDARASDIHIDPSTTFTRIRLRIDGILHNTFTLPRDTHEEVISRIKVCARLRADEHQAPQDGRFGIMTKADMSIDVRVSIAPTYHGENAVLRLLVDKGEHLTIENLGFSNLDRDRIFQAAKKSTGMILATGPTGSGKTTTLYSIIKTLNTPDISLVTIEDPIEYSIDGVEQIQVNAQTNLTFSSGLRSLLRQDPDIIMVGEIRDHETAQIAVNTALTGHLVLSTLHTNDAATTLPRLLDMHIEPYLVASTVSVAIGQRLVRRICEKCRASHSLSPGEKSRLLEIAPKHEIQGKNFFFGKGCEKCAFTGFRGRVTVSEVLVMNNDIREVILKKGSSADVRIAAIKSGMTTMLEDGISKVHTGVTTIGEILRVLHE